MTDSLLPLPPPPASDSYADQIDASLRGISRCLEGVTTPDEVVEVLRCVGDSCRIGSVLTPKVRTWIRTLGHRELEEAIVEVRTRVQAFVVPTSEPADASYSVWEWAMQRRDHLQSMFVGVVRVALGQHRAPIGYGGFDRLCDDLEALDARLYARISEEWAVCLLGDRRWLNLDLHGRVKPPRYG